VSKICRRYSPGMSPESTDSETNSMGEGPLADMETPTPKRTKRHQRRDSTRMPDNATPTVMNARSPKRTTGRYSRIPLGSGVSTQNRASSIKYPPVLQEVDPMQGDEASQGIREDRPSKNGLEFGGDDPFATSHVFSSSDHQHLSSYRRDSCHTTLDGSTTEF